MPQRPVGDFPIDPQLVAGTELANRLNAQSLALTSMNSGAARPNYLQPGGLWFDTTNGILWLYDGTQDNQVWPSVGGGGGGTTPPGGTPTPQPDPTPPPILQGDAVLLKVRFNRSAMARGYATLTDGDAPTSNGMYLSDFSYLSDKTTELDHSAWNNEWKLNDRILMYEPQDAASFARFVVAGVNNTSNGVELNLVYINGTNQNLVENDWVVVAREVNTPDGGNWGQPDPDFVPAPPYKDATTFRAVYGDTWANKGSLYRVQYSELNRSFPQTTAGTYTVGGTDYRLRYRWEIWKRLAGGDEFLAGQIMGTNGNRLGTTTVEERLQVWQGEAWAQAYYQDLTDQLAAGTLDLDDYIWFAGDGSYSFKPGEPAVTTAKTAVPFIPMDQGYWYYLKIVQMYQDPNNLDADGWWPSTGAEIELFWEVPANHVFGGESHFRLTSTGAGWAFKGYGGLY